VTASKYVLALLHRASFGGCDLLTRRDQLWPFIPDGNLSQLSKVLVRSRRIAGGFRGIRSAI
jgi:hypothetical protein